MSSLPGVRIFAPEMLAPGSFIGSGRNFDQC